MRGTEGSIGWRLLRGVVLLLVGIAVAGLLFAQRRFTPPTMASAKAAIGDLGSLPEDIRPWFRPGSAFRLLSAPGPHDWLAQFPERGQTYDQFSAAPRNAFSPPRQVLYLQPIGSFPADASPPLETLRDHAARFFQAEVRLLPVLASPSFPCRRRSNPFSHQEQWLTTDILTWLGTQVPADAFCILAVTMTDLFPEPSWNFVFGQASLVERVGVFSFARYDPAFYGEPRGTDHSRLLLLRSVKVLTHETGHMFGLYHCVHFCCLMNGSNHLAETDSRPWELCPVCLRKLYASIGFDPAKRYRELLAFARSQGFREESTWLEDHLKNGGRSE